MSRNKARLSRFGAKRQPLHKRLKALIAFLLLPLCFGVAGALLRVVTATGQANTVWVATLAGMACWLVIYLLLPKPMWLYVVGHELTHAVWTWLFGGKVKCFKATSNGGHVVVTKSNFLVALAPYFFPIYAAAIVILFVAGHGLWGWSRHLVWFHLLVGAAYAFHVTLTWHVLRTEQADIVGQGYLFSAVVIWLGNLGVLILGIPLLTARIELVTALDWCWLETAAVFQHLAWMLGIRS